MELSSLSKEFVYANSNNLRGRKKQELSNRLANKLV
jgi:hypothetical protein